MKTPHITFAIVLTYLIGIAGFLEVRLPKYHSEGNMGGSKMNKPVCWRAGGITTLIGGVGVIAVNILHPRPPARTDKLLMLVASVPYWTIIHYIAALAAVLVVSGLALLVRTLQDARAHALGEVGKYVITLGGAVFLVAFVVDGHSFPYFARR